MNILVVLWYQILEEERTLNPRREADASIKIVPPNSISTKSREAEALVVVVVLLTPETALRLIPTPSIHPKIEGRSLGEVTEDPNPNLRV